MPSVIGVPASESGRRVAKSSAEAASDCSSPDAIISASNIAVVCSTSTSSSTYCRRALFCTTSTPSVLPPRRIGTPRKEV